MSGESWRDDPLEYTPPVRGSGNFLRDQGYPNPIETKIKFALVNAIRQAFEVKKLRQVDVVRLVEEFDPAAGISQPDVSRILRGNVKNYSDARLMVVALALGNDLELVVQPVAKRPGRLAVRERELATA